MSVSWATSRSHHCRRARLIARMADGSGSAFRLALRTRAIASSSLTQANSWHEKAESVRLGSEGFCFSHQLRETGPRAFGTSRAYTRSKESWKESALEEKCRSA